jgi:polyphosphate kinase
VYLRDTAKSRVMQPDGTYVRAHATGARFNAQEWFMQQAIESSPVA